MRQELYSANVRSNNVSVINLDTKNIKNIQVGSYPYAIEVDNKYNRIFVTNQRSGTVSVIDLIKMKNIDTISVGEYPEGIDLHPNKINLYVANWFDNAVSVIDIRSMKVIAEIAVGEGCRAYGEFISR